MANSSQGSQTTSAPGARGATQSLVVVFERDESLAGSLLGQVRAQGYECRSARTPVEVFDLIARYPVGLVLVNLGQAATGRREFWVALDAQRRGRGVQVVTYRHIAPGMEPEGLDGSGRAVLADVEIRGAQGFAALIEAVRTRLPLLPRQPQTPDSGFLRSPTPPSLGAVRSHAAAADAALPQAPFSLPREPGARQQIAGVLNLSGDAQAGQPPEFAPLPGTLGAPAAGPGYEAWMPQANGAPSMPEGQAMGASLDPRVAQWMSGYPAAANAPQPAPALGRSAPVAQPEPTGNPELNALRYANGARGAPAMNGSMNGNGQQGGAMGLNAFAPEMVDSLPMGDLAGLTDAINALAAAGAPGYHQAASAMNTTNLAGNDEATRWVREMARSAQGSAEPANTPIGMNEGRLPSGQMPGMSQMPGTMMSNGQSGGYTPAENHYRSQQGFGGTHPAQEMSQPRQETRSRSLAAEMDDFDGVQRGRAGAGRGSAEDAYPGAGRRPSGGMGQAGGQAPAWQNQMLTTVAAPGQVERSLSTVLVEGQLVSQQRLEVTLGIQRLLRGADIDYRLGELLLLFKFLTPDQLLAALLVSRGLVSPAQVAAMGRIKQELHAIGMEYDLENLLILFRLLSSDQLREIRSEFP